MVLLVLAARQPALDRRPDRGEGFVILLEVRSACQSLLAIDELVGRGT